MGRKKKIAILRGPSLSKWEMQIYEPLHDRFDLLGVGARQHVNDTQGILFPCVFLSLHFGFFQSLPKYAYLMNTYLGDTRWLHNFGMTIAGYDILHSVELRTGFTLQAVRAKQKGLVKAVTATVYENIPFVGDEYPARLRLKQGVLPHIDHFFAVNEETRQALLVEGVETSRISIVPQSVDTVLFKPSQKNADSLSLRKKLRLEKGDFVVLSVGRMVWEKGWYDILRAARYIKLKAKSPELKAVRFVCVGDGPELNRLRQMVFRLGIEDIVIFTGNIPYREMPGIFLMADVFVLVSTPTRIWNEQFGGVLIEAMSAGLPVIGTLNGGIRSTIGDKGGIFVPPQDFAKLGDAILRLYSNPALVRKIGKRNRDVAVRFYDVHRVAKDIEKIWNSLF